MRADLCSRKARDHRLPQGRFPLWHRHDPSAFQAGGCVHRYGEHRSGPWRAELDLAKAGKKVKEICDKYGFDINPNQKIYDMSVSQKQTVEIVKVLYRGARIS